MKETWQSKVKYHIRRILRRIFGHKYGCCNRITKRCSRCKYVLEEPTDV